MDSIQLMIIGGVVLLIVITICYYLYKEARFKKMVENNFNQAATDVIIQEDKTFTLDGIDLTKEANISPAILQKDIVSHGEIEGDPLFDMHKAASINESASNIDTNFFKDLDGRSKNKDELSATKDDMEAIEYPEYSVEAFFANVHKINFPYSKDVDLDLDCVIEIAFEDIKKIKVLPEITQFTNKSFKLYVLDKDNQWLVYQKGEKYQAKALKLVVHLVDHEGIISQAQLSNIYNELHKFVIQNDGCICKSDYELSIVKIQEQLKHLENIELNLSLFLITQESYSYSDLVRFFSTLGLKDNAGMLEFYEDEQLVFVITAESGARFEPNKFYNLLQINSQLHRQTNPNHVVEQIFDCTEKFMHSFESRLLTSSRRVVEQADYDAILHHVKKYVENAKARRIELGGELIRRLFR